MFYSLVSGDNDRININPKISKAVFFVFFSNVETSTTSFLIKSKIMQLLSK